jgi:hypothetical protein
MADRRTKFLLGLIAVALSVIALRPLMPALDVSAQAPGPAAPAPGKISYQLVEATQTFQAESSINKLAAQGWRAKSVAVGADRTVVLMEKTAP